MNFPQCSSMFYLTHYAILNKSHPDLHADRAVKKEILG